MSRPKVLATDRSIADEEAEQPAEPVAGLVPLTRAIDRSRYIVLLVVAAVLLAVVAICVIAPLYMIATLWMVLHDTAKGDLIAHSGILKVLDLVILGLEAVAFYLVGIGLYHLFIAPVPLAHRLGLDTLDKLESRLVSVVIAMSAVAFVGHLLLGKSAIDVLIYGAAVALVVPALTWFKRHLD
jgi:uncharacterized membrane protein YqhA